MNYSITLIIWIGIISQADTLLWWCGKILVWANEFHTVAIHVIVVEGEAFPGNQTNPQDVTMWIWKKIGKTLPATFNSRTHDNFQEKIITSRKKNVRNNTFLWCTRYLDQDWQDCPNQIPSESELRYFVESTYFEGGEMVSNCNAILFTVLF